MKVFPFILFLILCVGMNVVYTIFNRSRGYKALLVRCLTILSCLGLAFVSSNLNSVSNAFPLLILFGLGLMLMTEAMIISEIDGEKEKMIVFGSLSTATFVMFAISIMSLSYFNAFAMFGGILLGVGIGCVVCAIKKYKKWYEVLSSLLIFGSLGFMLSESLFVLGHSTHIASSVLVFISATIMVVQQLLKTFTRDEGKMPYIINILYITSAILMASSIYFY